MSNLSTVANFLPDTQTHENRMEIKSASSNRIYVVAQSKSTGEWQCSCPGWVLKKAGKERTCKHLETMMPSLINLENKGKAKALPAVKAEEPAKKPSRQLKYKDVTLDGDTVMKLKKCLEDMDNRGVSRSKLQTSVRELVETIEKAIKGAVK